jgi:O-6-methylguanine DNA methyltransferase
LAPVPQQPVGVTTGLDAAPVSLKPLSSADVDALKAKRSELSRQLTSVQNRRDEVSKELRGTTAESPSAKGLEQRLSVMDERIVQLERDIAANGRDAVFYTIVPCALGFVLVAITSRGVHRVVLGDDPIVLEAALRDALPAAQVVRDDAALGDMSASMVALASGAALSHALPLDVRGTAFQQRVWRELQRIPRGETITYAELAARIGAPKAVRAVGTACGANPVALVVPCHRVVRADGSLGGYAWGVERKERLLRDESKTP